MNRPGTEAVRVLLAAALVSCGPDVRLHVLAPRGEEEAAPAAAGEGPLRVLFQAPVGTTTGRTEIAVGFDRPMIPLAQAGRVDTTPVFLFDPPIEGETRWLGTQIATFVPFEDPPLSTAFTVTVAPDLRALDGATLEEPFAWAFESERVEGYAFVTGDDRRAALDVPINVSLHQPVALEELRAKSAFHVLAGESEPTVVAALVEAACAEQPEDCWHDAPYEVPTVEGPCEVDGRLFVARPVEPLPPASSVLFTVSGELRPMAGTLTMGADLVAGFHVRDALRFLSCECGESPCSPLNPPVLHFSNPVRWSDLREHLHVSPRAPVDEHPSIWSEELRGEGTDEFRSVVDVRPDTTYTFVVDTELRDGVGMALAGPTKCEVHVGPYPPSVSLPVYGGVIEARGPRVVPVWMCNEAEAKFGVAALSPADMVPWAEVVPESPWERMEEPLPDLAGVVTRDIRSRAPRNDFWTDGIDLDRALGDGGRGLVALQPPDAYPSLATLFRVTDLGVSVKRSPARLAVWVTSLASGRPVGGAKVTIFDSEAVALWSGETDREGLAGATDDALGACRWGGNCRLYAVALKDGDADFVAFEREYSEWRPESADPVASVVGLVFSDRDLYEPGDTVHVKGYLRIETEQGLAIASGRRLLLAEDSAADAGSRGLVLPEDVRTGDDGAFAFDARIPGDAAPYARNIRVTPVPDDGPPADELTLRFEVKEFRAPDFHVDVTTGRESYVRGDAIAVRIKGRYLFGAPMAWSEVELWMFTDREQFAPLDPRWRGFRFGPERRWWEESESRGEGNGTWWEEMPDEVGRAVLGADGTVEIPYFPAGAGGPEMTRMHFEALIGSAGAAARTSVVLHPSEFQLGVRREGPAPTAGGSGTFQVIALDPDERPVPGVRATGRLLRRTWSVPGDEDDDRGDHGRCWWRPELTPEETEVGDCDVVTAAGAASCNVTFGEAGEYVLRLEATDGRGNVVRTDTRTWVSGDRPKADAPAAEPWVRLVRDRDEYRPGDVARIAVDSPFPEVEALVAVERGDILLQRHERIRGGSPVIEIPILESYRPGVTATVTLVRGRTGTAVGPDGTDLGKPVRVTDSVVLPVEIDSRRLDVTVEPDRGTYAPGDEVVLDLHVRDSSGAGTAASVTVFAVDEGMLQLTRYEPPDPVKLFWRDRPRLVSTWSMYDEIVDRTRLLERERGGVVTRSLEGPDLCGRTTGTGGLGLWDAGDLRDDFPAVAYWNPDVRTDRDGAATVRFRLPDSLTEFRIMAVAAAGADRWGTGRASLRVAKPLVLRPLIPPFARTGDRIEAGVAVTNVTGRNGVVTVGAEADGVQYVGETERSAPLIAGATTEVRFAIKAGAPGEAELRFRAGLEGEWDGLALALPIERPALVETVATYGETGGEVLEGLGSLDGLRRDFGGLTVSVASSPLVGLGLALDDERRILRLGTDDLVSQIVPFVAARELADGLGLAEPIGAQGRVSEALMRLPQFQEYSGGFFHDADRSFGPSVWLTAYAVWALRRAEEQGHAVPPDALDRADEFLDGWLVQSESWHEQHYRDVPPAPQDDPATWAFVLYVRACDRRVYAGELAAAYAERAQLGVAGTAFLALAYLRSGVCADASCAPVQELRRVIEARTVQEAGTAHFEEDVSIGAEPMLRTSTELNAIILEALLAIDSAHPLAAKVVRWLLAQRSDDGDWDSSWTSAWVLTALGTFYRTVHDVPPDFVAGVRLGEEDILATSFEGWPPREQSVVVPMSELPADGADVLFSTDGGAGKLYYALSLEYAPEVLPTTAIDRGFAVERRYQVLDARGARDATVDGDASRMIVHTGDQIRVLVTVGTVQTRGAVTVEDPLPPGLEFIDFGFESSARAIRRLAALLPDSEGEGDPADRLRGPVADGYRRSSFGWMGDPHAEFEHVTRALPGMVPGLYRYEYLLQAVTPGTYAVGPVVVQEVDTPEVFGRSGAVMVTVEP